MRALWFPVFVLAGFALLSIAGLFVPAELVDKMDYLNRFAPPSSQYWFGTDQLGRSLFHRILYGAGLTLGLSLLIALVSAAIGVLVGLFASFRSPWIRNSANRCIDIFLAVPELIAAITIVGVLGPGITNLCVALTAIGWMRYARLTQTLCDSLHERDFIVQARILGTPAWFQLYRHYLPALAPTILVLWSSHWSRAILGISSLGFLGIGLQPPYPEWGAMLLDAREFILSQPRLMYIPGLTIVFTVLLINLAGDSISDFADKKVAEY